MRSGLYCEHQGFASCLITGSTKGVLHTVPAAICLHVGPDGTGGVWLVQVPQEK